MPPLDDKQKQRIQGILDALNQLLDKRFEQARRVNPIIASVERDMRLHMQESIRQVLAGAKGFGPIKLLVADIFSSADEEKKRALMSPTDQVSLMNEIVPSEDEHGKERRTGQLEIRDIKSLYTALNPSLEKIMTLLQTWIWWDVRDAADLYRFSKQEERIKQLKAQEPDEATLDYYRQEMGLKAGVAVERKQMVSFELKRTAEVVELFARRRQEDAGYQVIIASAEREDNEAADALAVRLTKRLKTIETARSQSDPLGAQIREYYAPKLNVPVDLVKAQDVLDFERRQARLERQQLAEALFTVPATGKTGDYKQIMLADMQRRFAAICKSLGVKPEAVMQTTAPAAEEKEEEKPKEEEKQEDAQDQAPLMF